MKNIGLFFVFFIVLLSVYSVGEGIQYQASCDSSANFQWDSDVTHDSATLPSFVSGQEGRVPVSWWIDTVDSEGNTGRYTSVVVDSNGWPHVSYCREDDGGYVKYAYWTGCKWEVVTLDEGSGGDNGNMLATAIALDNHDCPFIAYAKPPGEIKCVYWDGVQWRSDTVYSGDGVYGSVGIELDSNHYPHISYCDGYGSRHMRYAYWDGTLWHNEVVDDEGVGGIHNSLVIDTNNVPHIAYTDATHRTLQYAIRNGNGTWTVETVDSGNQGPLLYPAIELDKENQPHIGYYDTSNYDLKYSYKTASMEWYIQSILTGENVCYSYSLALDSLDSPHFMCQNIDSKDLIYVYRDGEGWISEVIDNEGDVGCCSDIVFDAYDCACISYRDERLGNLKFARAQAFSINVIEPQPGLYLNNQKLMSLPITIAIGTVDISLEIADQESEMDYIQLYINGEEKARLDELPYTWQFVETTFGACSIVAVAHDVAGNYGVQKTMMWKFF